MTLDFFFPRDEMNKIVGVIGKRYCLYKHEGEPVLFDRMTNSFVDSFYINKEKAETVLKMETEEARLAAHEL